MAGGTTNQVAGGRINVAAVRCAIALAALIGLAGLATAESTQLSDETRQALLSCAFIDPPPLRDGSVATRVDMEQMAVGVKRYAADMQTALACIDAVTERSDPEEHRFIDYMYNNGVEQMNMVLTSYNERVKMYRRYENIRNIEEVTP